MAVYGQTRAGQQWPIVGCKGGSWVVLGDKVDDHRAGLQRPFASSVMEGYCR